MTVAQYIVQYIQLMPYLALIRYIVQYIGPQSSDFKIFSNLATD